MGNDDAFLSSAQHRKAAYERTLSLVSLASKPNAPSSSDTAASVVLDGVRHVLRPPNPGEITTLETTCRCLCDDWRSLRLLYVEEEKGSAGGDLSERLVARVSDCAFAGAVVLGVGARGGAHRNGLVRDCVLEPGCDARGNSVLERTHLRPGARVVNCGTVTTTTTTTSSSSLGSVLEVRVGPETGGARALRVCAESTMVDACRCLTAAKSGAPIRDLVRETAASAFSGAAPLLNVLLPGASLSDNPNLVRDVFLCEDASVSSSCTVSNATLLPGATIASHCDVSDASLQWGCTVSRGAALNNVLLMEGSVVSNHAVVDHSVVGPDVHLESGETHHCLIGPNTNSHHQSLLIAVVWPLGRGNVGYGANVGSNHTGRTADQECWAGEGTFWGLDCVVKFPVDLTDSPYSIVASGTTLAPQRVAAPFSLFSDGGAVGETRVHPGWVLGRSAYTIARAEIKFAKRRTAVRHAGYAGWRIARPSVVESCRRARARLTAAASARDVEGLGACALTEDARRRGAAFYANFVRRYALRGLLRRAERTSRRADALMGEILASTTSSSSVATADVGPSYPSWPWEEPGVRDPESEWDYQRALIASEYPVAVSTWEHLLRELARLEDGFARDVARSKARDDARGRSVVPGYADAHVSAEDDEVVRAVAEEARRVRRTTDRLLSTSTRRSRL